MRSLRSSRSLKVALRSNNVAQKVKNKAKFHFPETRKFWLIYQRKNPIWMTSTTPAVPCNRSTILNKTSLNLASNIIKPRSTQAKSNKTHQASPPVILTVAEHLSLCHYPPEPPNLSQMIVSVVLKTSASSTTLLVWIMLLVITTYSSSITRRSTIRISSNWATVIIRSINNSSKVWEAALAEAISRSRSHAGSRSWIWRKTSCSSSNSSWMRIMEVRWCWSVVSLHQWTLSSSIWWSNSSPVVKCEQVYHRKTSCRLQASSLGMLLVLHSKQGLQLRKVDLRRWASGSHSSHRQVRRPEVQLGRKRSTDISCSRWTVEFQHLTLTWSLQLPLTPRIWTSVEASINSRVPYQLQTPSAANKTYTIITIRSKSTQVNT